MKHRHTNPLDRFTLLSNKISKFKSSRCRVVIRLRPQRRRRVLGRHRVVGLAGHNGRVGGGHRCVVDVVSRRPKRRQVVVAGAGRQRAADRSVRAHRRSATGVVLGRRKIVDYGADRGLAVELLLTTSAHRCARRRSESRQSIRVRRRYRSRARQRQRGREQRAQQ